MVEHSFRKAEVVGSTPTVGCYVDLAERTTSCVHLHRVIRPEAQEGPLYCVSEVLQFSKPQAGNHAGTADPGYKRQRGILIANLDFNPLVVLRFGSRVCPQS